MTQTMTERPWLTPREIETLEAMIDRAGVSHVLNGLATVCRAKAARIDGDWQEHSVARRWTLAGARLALTAIQPKIVQLD